MIEAELRALDKAEARMKVVESSKAKRSTAKQQADHSRTKNTALQVLLQRPDIYLTLIKTPLEVYDANNVMDATSKITVRGPQGGELEAHEPSARLHAPDRPLDCLQARRRHGCGTQRLCQSHR